MMTIEFDPAASWPGGTSVGLRKTAQSGDSDGFGCGEGSGTVEKLFKDYGFRYDGGFVEGREDVCEQSRTATGSVEYKGRWPVGGIIRGGFRQAIQACPLAGDSPGRQFGFSQHHGVLEEGVGYGTTFQPFGQAGFRGFSDAYRHGPLPRTISGLCELCYRHHLGSCSVDCRCQ